MMNKYVLIGLITLWVSSTSARAVESRGNQDLLDQSLRQEAIAGIIPWMAQLIQQGANINVKAPHGESALEYAIRFGR